MEGGLINIDYVLIVVEKLCQFFGKRYLLLAELAFISQLLGIDVLGDSVANLVPGVDVSQKRVADVYNPEFLLQDATSLRKRHCLHFLEYFGVCSILNDL